MKSNDIDMTNGPIFGKLVTFLIPMILSNLLQQFYQMADMIVAGRFAGSAALAAIGATGHLMGLITNVLLGVSVGVSTVVAQVHGSGDKRALSGMIHSSMSVGIIGGVLFGIIGFVFCKPLLVLMKTPDSILDQSVLYMRIIFLGLPISSFYNFGSAVLRAKGDTKRPLLFLTISGAVNVILNLVFVIGFNMDVEGVAIPTVISQLISALMVLFCLLNEQDAYQLFVRRLRVRKKDLKRILLAGIPMGIQSSMFSISNVIIQSSINSFGEMAVAGCAAANNINSLLYTLLNTFSHAATIFCGQNFGAKKPKRVLKSLLLCSVSVTVTGIVVGGAISVFTRNILGLFVEESKAIEFGMEYINITSITYFLCGLMEVVSGGLRALDKASIAMVNSVLALCGTRILWIYTYFAAHRSIFTLYCSYPISWIVSLFLHTVFFMWFFRKWKKSISDGVLL